LHLFGFPLLAWSKTYNRAKLVEDIVAALIVTIMLVPQSLAYALLAGLPPETGLYASIFGLAAYSLFGSSNSLSVAPVAVVSLMTAAALGKLVFADTGELLAAAMSLALMSGLFLLILGVLRLGFMANFISHPVINAFVNSAAFIIALSQMQYLLGINAGGHNIPQLVTSIGSEISQTNWLTLGIGLVALAFIVFCKRGLKELLLKLRFSRRLATFIARSGPLIVVVVTAVAAYSFNLEARGVQVLGDVPEGLPGIGIPSIGLDLLASLWTSALLISIIGFVESISVAQSLAARKGERIDLDQELVGLGTANVASSMGGGFPITGGFARSAVNFDAGAATPAAGLITAVLLYIVVMFLTPYLYWIPRVCLAAIILAAISSLVDFSMLRKAWVYSKADFIAVAITFLLTLLVGIEVGIAAGVLVSLLIHLYKTSQPHVAIVGRVPGTEHFRNVDRHDVETFDNLLSIRIDESLYFANTHYLEELIFKLVAERDKVKHVILMCTAVNKVDLSALETLEKMSSTLADLDIKLHLSEVKGPIMDSLSKTTFFKTLTGNCYMSHNQAVEALRGSDMPLSGL